MASNSSCFSINQLVETKDVNFLHQFGGVHRVAALLQSDTQNGIPGDQTDLHRRLSAFGSNQFSLLAEGQSCSLETKCLRELLLEAFKDTTFILLLCCAALSLAIGIIDVALIFLFIAFVYFGVLCKYIKSRWMIKKRLMKQKRVACVVVRAGEEQEIPASEVVVGDLVCLKKGNEVPADGLIIHGDSSFKLDCGHKASNLSRTPSMFTGSMVAQGECKMLVTSVGKNTERSKFMMRLLSNKNKQKGSDYYDDSSSSKLQIAIDKMSSNLENAWLILSLLVLVVQVFRCFVWESKLCDGDHNPDAKGVKNTLEEMGHESAKLVRKRSGKVNGLVAMLCILLFALRDCLPLGILTTFLYASKKVKPYKAIVRKLQACATLGLITTICICNTDDLALQYSKMAKLWIGLTLVEDISTEVNHQAVKLIREAIHFTCDDQVEYDALFCWAQKVLSMDVDELQKNTAILHSETPDLHRRYSTVVPTQRKEPGHVLDVHWKGEPGVILTMCSHYCGLEGTMQALDEEKRARFIKIAEDVGSDNSLRCLAFAFKRVTKEDIEDPGSDGEDESFEYSLEQGLTWLGLVSLKNPYAPEVRQSVEACVQSGVKIKLVVDDDLRTAGFMARYSGILGPDDEEDMSQAVIEASVFRNSSEEDRMKMINSIHVLADASPVDKLLMVQCLKQKADEVVAVTGRCSRDYPSLKEADVGLLMGDHCAECIKEDVEVVVFGLNIGMISTLVRFGRCVCLNLEKFIDLQLTVNVAAFTINFIVMLFTSEVQFAAFELLWVNIIMEVLGALALSIQTVELLPSVDNSQVKQQNDEPIMLNVYGTGPVMWSNIALHSLFKVTILVILSMKGKSILEADEGVLKTMIFLCYVLCQVFALLGAMKIVTKDSSFLEGLMTFKNYVFLMIVGIIVAMQAALIEIMAITEHWRKINLKQWGICTVLAVLSMPIDFAVNRVKYHISA